MKVTIDQEKCVASGQCVAAPRTVFDQRDEDGIVVLLDRGTAGGAGRRCPAGRGGLPGPGHPAGRVIALGRSPGRSPVLASGPLEQGELPPDTAVWLD